jgi:hypothetical protein
VKERLLVVMLLVTCGCTAAFPNSPPLVRDGLPLVSYCELVSSPETYFNKEVRLRAVYRVGFEWQQVYSVQCLEAPNMWVEFVHGKHCPVAYERDGPVKDEGSPDGSLEMSGKTFGVVFRGRLTGWGGGYGHLDSFASEFQVTCMEELTLLDLDSYYPTALTPEMKKRIETFDGKPPR